MLVGTCRKTCVGGGPAAVLALVCVAASAAAQAHGSARADEHGGPSRRLARPRAQTPRAPPLLTRRSRPINEENGAQFVATTTRRARYEFGALPMGKYTVSTASAGLTTFRRRGVEIAMDGKATLDITLDAASAAAAAEFERQELLQKIATLEQRVADLETSTVLSEPETRVRRVEVYVDPTGQQHDEPVPGAKKEVTYLRERTYRRQTISEKIDAALEDAAKHQVTVGVDAAMATQFAVAHPGRYRSQTTAPTPWRRRTCFSRRGSPRTRCSSPTSSA